MKFGDRLKEVREQKNLTRAELAFMLDVSPSAISNYENGISSPKEEILLKIFNCLDIEPNFLFQDSYKEIINNSLMVRDVDDIKKDNFESFCPIKRTYNHDIINSEQNKYENTRKRMKYIRVNLFNMSVEDFAKDFTFKPDQYRAIECGEIDFDSYVISDITRVYDANYNWLMFDQLPIFEKVPQIRLTALSKEYNLSKNSTLLLKRFLNFDVKKRETLSGILLEMFHDSTEERNTSLDSENIPNTTNSQQTQSTYPYSVEIIQLPVFEDIKASAGLGSYLDDSIKPIIQNFERPDVPLKADHGIYLKGNSMEPLLEDGQLVFVSKQPSIEFGEIGIFVYNEEVYCKRLVKDGKKIILRSINEDYKDLVIENAYPLITVGKVLL